MKYILLSHDRKIITLKREIFHGQISQYLAYCKDLVYALLASVNAIALTDNLSA